jgi:S-adenosylmethionine-dependent methyltransferase
MTLEHFVRSYYDKRAEEEWGRYDRHRMEFAVTMRSLEPHLPPAGKILDCGGGPGRYSLWLAQKGYDVTLFDLSEACLAKAKREAGSASLRLSYELGNATDLSRFEDASFDVVILLGPLYHLKELDDRTRALSEAVRVLKLGGLIATAFLTRTAPLRYIAKSEAGRVLELYGAMINVINQGYDASYPPLDEDHFHAYFSHPTEIEPLFKSTGVEVLSIVAAKGFVSMINETVNTLQGEEWEAWVDLNVKLATDPSLLSGAEHLLAIGTKPQNGP